MDVKKDICSDFFIITIWEEKKMKGKVKKDEAICSMTMEMISDVRVVDFT